MMPPRLPSPRVELHRYELAVRAEHRRTMLFFALLLPLLVLLVGGAAPQRDVDGECAVEASPIPAGVHADSTTELSIDINLHAFRVDVHERGAAVATYRIAAGMPRYPTPIGDYQMDYLIWNPEWIPPDREWARHERRQAPGPDNWMGRVKLHVTDMVFMHGSPFERSLGSASSHACMRMGNADAVALARTVLRVAGSSLSPAEIEALEADPHHTRTVVLTRTVPVHLRYQLAEIRADSLALYPDIYRRARTAPLADAWRALATVGIDSLALSPVSLGRLVRSARRRSVVVGLDSLRKLEATKT